MNNIFIFKKQLKLAAYIFALVINLKILNIIAFLFLFKFKILKILEDYNFILNIKNFRKINVIIFKSNKIPSSIKFSRGYRAIYITINKLYRVQTRYNNIFIRGKFLTALYIVFAS